MEITPEIVAHVLFYGGIAALVYWLTKNNTRSSRSRRNKSKGKTRIVWYDKEMPHKDKRCNDYHKHTRQKKYLRSQLTSHLNGRKVRAWKWVYSAWDASHDEFIPLFYKKRRKKVKRRHKR